MWIRSKAITVVCFGIVGQPFNRVLGSGLELIRVCSRELIFRRDGRRVLWFFQIE